MWRAWPERAAAIVSGSSRPTWAPAPRSASWQSRASVSGSGSWPRARSSATEKAALEDRPAPTGSVLVTRTVPPEGGGRCSRRSPAARRASGGTGAASPRAISSGWSGELVRVDPDEEAAGLGREGDLGGEVDGHRQREAAVVVGVVADDGDSSGGAGRGHLPSLAQVRAGLTVEGGSGHDPAMADRSGPLSGIKIIELAGIGPAPYTCMMLADAGAQVLRLERAAPGAVERGEERALLGCRALLGPAEPVTAVGRDRPQEPGRRRARAGAGRAGRRADRGLPARRGRAARGRGPRRASPGTGASSTDA